MPFTAWVQVIYLSESSVIRVNENNENRNENIPLIDKLWSN